MSYDLFDEFKLLRWHAEGKSGQSSLTIASAFVDYPWIKIQLPFESIPYDTGDFLRCLGLLEVFPEWRAQLSEVSDKYPRWKPFVERWDVLTALFGDPECQRMIDFCVSVSEESE